MKKNNPVIEILIAGDEILSDPIREKNAQYIADSLRTAGFEIDFITIAGDNFPNLSDAMTHSSERADIVFITGGLGPTSDDITVETFAETFGLKLVFDEHTMRRIAAMFKHRNLEMNDSNRKQAMIPEGAKVLKNPMGTAPGIFAHAGNTDFYFMPGVPAEMEKIFDEAILPRVLSEYECVEKDTAILRLTGINESELYGKIGGINGAKEAVRYYPGLEGITLKIITDANAQPSASEISDKICEKVGNVVFSTVGESLESVVGNMLREKGLTVAVAESCTGGRISNRLIKVPGASEYVNAGVIAYSNESKHKILGVDKKLIETYGAVSAEVAGAMSEGVRRITGADIGLSTTGIAGPGGGSVEKPVGLMYTGITTEKGTETKKLQFFKDRLINMGIMSQAVLNNLRYSLINLR
ncbi:competence/damage-inducible protein A [Candidatus Latescibacterota bacterium]